MYSSWVVEHRRFSEERIVGHDVEIVEENMKSVPEYHFLNITPFGVKW